MLKDQDAAADKIQQLFVSLWEKKDTLHIDGSIKSYLLRSAHNACLNAIKHQKIKAEHSEQTLFGATDSEQRDLLEEEEFKLKVRGAVQKLPTLCRKIFLMSRIQGKKYQQIADELSLSVKTYFNLNKQNLIEPRAGLRYEVGRSKWINAGFGMHSATHDLWVYSAKASRANGSQYQPNKKLGMTRSIHYVLGYEQMVTSSLRVKAEVYYQDLFDVPIIDSANSAFSGIYSFDGYVDTPLKNKGTGHNYGAEITVEKYFTNNWFMMATSSIYQSKYVGGDGKERNTL